jgi:hypothetical protein
MSGPCSSLQSRALRAPRPVKGDPLRSTRPQFQHETTEGRHEQHRRHFVQFHPRACERAEAAHGEHEKRIGKADPDWPDWPDWYAKYMVAEKAGEELPL